MASDDDTNGHDLSGSHEQPAILNSMADHGAQKQIGLEIDQQPGIQRSSHDGRLFNGAWNFNNLDGDKQSACDSLAEQTTSSTLAMSTGISSASIAAAPSVEAHTPSIFRLPIETLAHIFSYVDEPLLNDKNGVYIRKLYEIKNVRLTCKKFYDNSSHLLVRSLQLGIDKESLALLHVVSMHPIISKGVRRINVIMRFFAAEMVDDIHMFALEQSSNLAEAIQHCEKLLSLPSTDDATKDKALFAASEFKSMARSWKVDVPGLADDLSNPTDLARIQLQNDIAREASGYMALLQKAHEFYKQCYHDQQELVKERFVEAVATSLRRMPRARALEFRDQDISRLRAHCSSAESWFDGATDRAKLIRDMVAPSSIEELMMSIGMMEESQQGNHWETVSTPKAIFELFTTLPIAIHKAGVWLTRLAIYPVDQADMSCWSMIESKHTELQEALQRLKEFVFRPEFSEFQLDWTQPQMNDVKKYLSAILYASTLETMDISLFNYADRRDTPPPSFQGLFALRCWPKLQDCTLDTVCISLGDIRRIADNFAQSTDSFIYLNTCRLTDGSWADVLDILRTNRSRTKSSRHWQLYAPQGAECPHMTPGEYGRIFSIVETPTTVLGVHMRHPSLAELYIGGHVEKNPLRG